MEQLYKHARPSIFFIVLFFMTFLALVYGFLSQNNPAKASAKTMPDLAVAKVEVKKAPYKCGGKASVQFVIKNRGSAPSGPFKIKVMPHEKMGKVVYYSVPGLLPGGIFSKSVDYNIPVKGKYNITVTADYDRSVLESNELNNENTLSFSIGRSF